MNCSSHATIPSSTIIPVPSNTYTSTITQPPDLPGDDVRLRDELISAITHDVRSPIGAIGIFCEILMMSKDKLDEQQLQSLKMIMEANTKAQRIIEDAAEISRLYKGRLTLDLTPTSLARVVERAVDAVRQTLNGKPIIIETDISPDLQVISDASHVEMILLRLLEEAVAYAGAASTIRLSSTQDDDMVQLNLALSGTAASTKPRSPESLKGRLGDRKTGSTFYSLTAAALLAEAMRGNLTWQTEPPFAGSLMLPSPPA